MKETCVMDVGEIEESNQVRRNIVKLFEPRKGHLDYRIKRDYVRNGIATIPCRISDYSDVISTYSVESHLGGNEISLEYDKVRTDMHGFFAVCFSV